MEEQEITNLVAIIERRQTEHWGIDCCRCWFCKAARKAGCKPRSKYLSHNRQETDE